jgi:hypothetical protein
MSITKLDKPLVIGGKAVYPQTSADQVIMSDGKTLDEIIENIGSPSSSSGNVSVNLDSTEETGEVVPLNADTLGGYSADYFGIKPELLWKNSNVTSAFVEQTISLSLNVGDVLFIPTLSFDQQRHFVIIVVESKRKMFILGDVDDNVFRLNYLSTAGIEFGAYSGTSTNVLIPTHIYRIAKGAAV